MMRDWTRLRRIAQGASSLRSTDVGRRTKSSLWCSGSVARAVQRYHRVAFWGRRFDWHLLWSWVQVARSSLKQAANCANWYETSVAGISTSRHSDGRFDERRKCTNKSSWRPDWLHSDPLCGRRLACACTGMLQRFECQDLILQESCTNSMTLYTALLFVVHCKPSVVFGLRKMQSAFPLSFAFQPLPTCIPYLPL